MSENSHSGGGDSRPPFDICERTFQLGLSIIGVCQQLNQTPGVNWALSNQLVRSGTSVGANVEEGQAAQSKADFVSKYSIARKELRETHYFLRLLRGAQLLDAKRAESLLRECDELKRILTTIIKNAQP
jgi:four helix bundle protein